jgi:hypothetical protein
LVEAEHGEDEPDCCLKLVVSQVETAG